jgi:TonB family protein
MIPEAPPRLDVGPKGEGRPLQPFGAAGDCNIIRQMDRPEMFESSFAASDRLGRTRRDRLTGVLVTLVFHGLLGLLVYHGRFIIKIMAVDKKVEVRDIVLVPPLKVSIPKVVGGHGLASEPAEALGAPGPGGPVQPRTAREKPKSPPEAAGEEPAGLPATPSGGTALIPSAGAAVPSLSSKFQQSIAIRGRSELTIPLAPPGTPPGPPGISGGAPLPDFSKYGRGVTGGGGYGTGRGRLGTGGGGGGRQRIGVSIPLKNYDLLPWATVVVDRLQLHWTLPSVMALPDKAKISFIVVIKKSGELDSIEILEGTTVEVLDRAALEAIRGALPFPALPADFPGDLLEITFEFVYND